MQNKANFRKSQMNASSYITKKYEQMDTWSIRKNKPNSNPIQSQFKPNTKPIRTQFKPKQTQFIPNFRGKNMLNLKINPRLKSLAEYANKLGLQYIFRDFWRIVRRKLSKRCSCLDSAGPHDRKKSIEDVVNFISAISALK
jgi:hypothetical protein